METTARDVDGHAGATVKAEEILISKTPPVEPSKPHLVDSAPDPDEDDLDDLDDMLEEFSAPKVDENEQPPAGSGPGRPSAVEALKSPVGLDGITDDEFAKQLQTGMAGLLGNLQTSVGPEMQLQFENMLQELGGSTALGEAPTVAATTQEAQAQDSTTTNEAGPPVGAEESFQETIKKTMDRMQASGEQATAAAAADDSDDIIAELMKQMQAGAGLEGEDNEEDFSKMLLGMMEQLTNKEILYEPMKELDDKFPEWIEKNKSKTPQDDMKRYEEQRIVVREIVAKFEEKTYSDSNVADREYIVERMQKMQAAGSPPPDLVGDMASAQEALGAPEEGCSQQ